jgi:hypothetical protein
LVGVNAARRLIVLMRRLVVVFMLSAASITPLAGTMANQASPLETPRLAVRLSAGRVPLTLALQQLGVSIRGGYVLFGLEVQVVNGKEPSVSLAMDPGCKVGDAILQILNQVPGYKLDVISEHLVNIYPAAAKDNPGDPLNMQIPHFDVDSQKAGVILSWPARFIPELYQRLASNTPSGPGQHIDLYVGAVAVGPEMTLHLRNVTVRQILNAVTEASDANAEVEAPLGWEYSYVPQTEATHINRDSWRLLMTVPPDWKEYAAKVPARSK